MRDISPASKPYIQVHSDVALGILVCERKDDPPFAESSFIKRLHVIGARRGMRLFAFDPWTWEPRNETVKAWVWNIGKSRWESGRRKLPTIVYDRSWPETEEEKNRYRQAMRNIRTSRKIRFLNGRLPHKGKVYEVLSKDRALAAIIPPTALYKGSASLSAWLRKHRHAAFLKPIAGSQGRRVVSIARTEEGRFRLAGRQQDNRPVDLICESEQEAIQRLERWIGVRSYLMQPLLELKGQSAESLDFRELMQKDKFGRWTSTGVAARLGAPGSVTANLHGGGKAASAEEVLTELFGEQRGNALLQEMRRISFLIVARLEETFGRFAEIGLDYGVDRGGTLWFLEANSKPGRTAMGSAGEGAAQAAAEQPLSYARSILLRLATTDMRRPPQGGGYASPGRVIHEFDHL
ncbi:YheC/YheD family protein [Cohnella lupini]|uniref:YheC/D-like protein n=1 Tax=Cohnella lupini TaxID=1294267 RepID=A0A3D9IQQ9_9BACL|nr:YheC/YheD family protein [Cohnella lupini]RED64065.1 YheC/D-like protein [Cohnella lupini]